MADDKHKHEWEEDRKVMNIKRGKFVTTTYYKCSGCPLTKSETEEK